jgi:GNAT superfamily N-acetyltransferase
MTDVVVRVAGGGDEVAVATLRSLWHGDAGADPAFVQRLAEWMAAEGERRTTWLAELEGAPVGMAWLLEYRRMPWPGKPDSRWGYVSNMFVREDLRNRGIGSALLAAVVAAAEARDYARLVVSPSEEALTFYARGGFVAADGEGAADLLLVRPRGGGGL